MSTHGRETGYLLVTPLKVGGGGTIFVNRGWVPASIKAAIPKEMLPEGECSLVVVPRPSEKGGRAVMDNDPSKDFWLKIDAPAMARHLGMREDLPFCDLVEPDGGGKPPINKTTADFITFYCTPLTHAAYSFTWFSLSAALAAGTHLRFR